MKIVKIGGNKRGVIIPAEILDKVLGWTLETPLDYDVRPNYLNNRLELTIREVR